MKCVHQCHVCYGSTRDTDSSTINTSFNWRAYSVLRPQVTNVSSQGYLYKHSNSVDELHSAAWSPVSWEDFWRGLEKRPQSTLPADYTDLLQSCVQKRSCCGLCWEKKVDISGSKSGTTVDVLALILLYQVRRVHNMHNKIWTADFRAMLLFSALYCSLLTETGCQTCISMG